MLELLSSHIMPKKVRLSGHVNARIIRAGYGTYGDGIGPPQPPSEAIQAWASGKDIEELAGRGPDDPLPQNSTINLDRLAVEWPGLAPQTFGVVVGEETSVSYAPVTEDCYQLVPVTASEQNRSSRPQRITAGVSQRDAHTVLRRKPVLSCGPYGISKGRKAHISSLATGPNVIHAEETASPIPPLTCTIPNSSVENESPSMHHAATFADIIPDDQLTDVGHQNQAARLERRTTSSSLLVLNLGKVGKGLNKFLTKVG